VGLPDSLIYYPKILPGDATWILDAKKGDRY